MPFVQIHLAQHFTALVKKKISTAVHESLIEQFKIPVNDFFQVIHCLPPGDILYPENYMDIPHTNNLVFIHITAKDGRDAATKKALYHAIATKIAAQVPISVNDVIIILQETGAENWSFGQGKAQMIS